jgi:hypothetical protein
MQKYRFRAWLKNINGISLMPSHFSNSFIDRAWVDGCFDLMHFGHANALRQVNPFELKAFFVYKFKIGQGNS